MMVRLCRADVLQVHDMSRRSQRRRKRVIVAKASAPRLNVPGATGLRMRSLFQPSRPMSVAGRSGRFAIAVPLMLIGAAGAFLVVALPGTYGKSTWSIVGMN